MKASKKRLSLAVVGALNAGLVVGLAVPPAHAQQQTAQEPAKIEKVEVVGSSIKRSLEDQSLPVQVITKDDINKSGVQNMEQLVRQIAATASTGSVNGTTLAGQASYGQSSVSLRGLGSVRTLVLLDGQRMTPFAQELATGVDIQSLPISAIERVEVLTDGASSIYGSDAVAGVVNFVLRRNYTGITAGYEYDTPTRSGSGGTTNNFWASGGYGDLSKDKYNFTLSYQWKKEDSLLASTRDFSKTSNLPPYYVAGATPSGALEGVWHPGAGATPFSTDPAQAKSGANPYGYARYYGNPGADLPGGCASMLMYDVHTTPKAGTGTNNCAFDSAPFVELFPSVKTQSGVGTADVQITPDMRLYFTGLYTQNKVQEAYQPSPVRGSFLSTDNAFIGSGVDAELLIYPQNPHYPHAWLQSHGLGAIDGQVLGVSNRAFAAGERTELDTNTQQQWIGGIKGTWFKDWDYDINGQYSQSKSEGTVVAGYFSQLAFVKAWNTVGNTPGSYVDPWSPGGVQNDTLAGALASSNYVGPTATAKESLSSFNAKTSGNIYDLPAGPVAMSIGFSNVWQNYNVAVPDILGSGDIAGLGGATATQNGSRIVTSGYLEFAIPATKTINLDVSGRIDHYNDLQKDATPITGKISATWQPYSWGMVRGSIGNGFRAPSMGELHKPVTLGTSEEFIDPTQPSGNCPCQVNASTGGNPLLEPEKSQQGDLGFVWTPAPNFTARIDWWAIKIDKYIVTPSALSEVNAALAGGFLYFPGEVKFAPDGTTEQVTETLQNAGKATFEGLDFAANYRVPSPWGTWTLDYQGTYYLKANLNLTTGIEHNVGTLVGPPPDLNPLTLPIAGGVIPRYKQNVSLNWAYGAWGATVANHLVSGYQDAPEQATGNQHSVNSTSIWDAQITYSGIKYLQLVAGVRNLMDTNPQLYIPTSNLFTYGFDPSVYDPRGRVVYGRVIFSY